jgi:hypothetical protein
MMRMAAVNLIASLLTNVAVAQAPSTSPATPMPSANMSTTKPPMASTATTPTSSRFKDEASAKAHCPADTVVWLNTASKVYHMAGTKYYGNTKKGAYICQKDADQGGFHVAKGETAATPSTTKP